MTTSSETDQTSPFDFVNELLAGVSRQHKILANIAGEHIQTLLPQLAERAMQQPKALPGKMPHEIWNDAFAYAVDALQRQVLFWDTMREAGNGFIEHERNGCPPLLAFEYEVIMDGRELARPVNYKLVRIKAPEGYPSTDPCVRPFVVIDPRAGHGAGIGGFKSDSEVGMALQRCHPVYFVVFSREPEPGQTILDVTAAERQFLQAVVQRHPLAPKPVVIGNCQGGWAAMLLGASAPELSGPLVLNGAPLSYWAGRTGRNPMRYVGGLVGGSWPTLLLSDLGNGRFDGAHLGLNFEAMSPSNTWFRKYYDLYARVNSEAPRFLEFERWWGGMFLMNGEEMSWIVENLFVGNRFSSDQLMTESGEPINIRAVRSPIIVFASEGDNITPLSQALQWIPEVYRDEQEIKASGQTIVYLIHKSIGHLGIFVSGAVARKEHHEIGSVLDVIEAVAPGLYEMQITGQEEDGYKVDLVETTMADIHALVGDRLESVAFPVVAQISEANSQAFRAVVSPVLRQFANEPMAELNRRLHPMRLRRYLISDANPAMATIAVQAEMVKCDRRPVAPDNMFAAIEHAWAQQMEHAIDGWRDVRDAAVETIFFGVYGWLAAFGMGQGGHKAAPKPAPSVASVDPRRYREGGYAEAVVRMMLLLARARGAVRREPLQRSTSLMRSDPHFIAMTDDERHELIQTQTALVAASPEDCIATLPALLPNRSEKEKALRCVEEVAGPAEELGASVRDMLQRFRIILGVIGRDSHGATEAAEETECEVISARPRRSRRTR